MERFLVGGLECWVFGRENGEKAPVIFFIHGLTQSVQFSLRYCKSLAENGYIGIAIDLRNHGARSVDLSLNQKGSVTYLQDTYGVYTGTAQDISHIIDFLPAVFGFIPRKVGVMGFSLGGHCSMVARVIDRRINFVVPICGTTDRKSMLKSRFIQKGGSGDEFEKNLPIGMNEAFQKYEPINNLEKLKGCEIFLISGGKDFVVPSTTNEKLIENYRNRYESQENITLKLYPEATHEVSRAMWTDILDWLEKQD